MDKIKILIAEDSVTQAMQLQHILEEHNYDVAIAANGREALRSISEVKPSIVISDIIMPEMDGYELCRQIKSSESYRDISLILLTSLSQPQAVIWALQCGADKFITKPYDEQLLLSTLEQLHLKENPDGREDSRKAIPISFRGETYLIASNRLQILNLLLSTYETAVAKNFELATAQDELKRLNEGLEEMVHERTASLSIEVDVRKAAEAALQIKNEELNTALQQLWQAAKLATMGELAASIAHELNNPLATVSLRVESLIARTQTGSPDRRELEIIEQEVTRMSNLIANLLQFSRRSTQQISTADICEEVEKTLELVSYHLRKYNVTVVREFAPHLPMIHADRQQLRQLFMNLFTNASDAMPRGGTLTIRVTAPPESRLIIIEVADTGTGISPEILSKVEEAFYTTKPEGKGTGLGLAICRRIVQEHNGTFDLTSEGIPGKGATARISLPATNGTNAASLKDEENVIRS
jgi:signal transduction histidine kinase